MGETEKQVENFAIYLTQIPSIIFVFLSYLKNIFQILGEVKLSNGRGNSEVDVKISTLQDNILYQRRSSNPGKFSFHTPSTYTGQSVPDLEAEDIDPDDEDTYQFCVHHYQYGTRDSGGALDKNRLIEFKWKAVPLDGYGSERSRSAKKMSTDTLQLAMNEMRNELLKITKELSGLQQRERVLVKRNEKAAKHVVFYAVLSILVAGGVSAFQVHYFQRFFKARKIL